MVALFVNHTRLNDTLQKYDVEKVNPELLELVKNMVETLSNGLSREDQIASIAKLSLAAGALMAWIFHWIESVEANIMIPKEYEQIDQLEEKI